MFIKIFFMYLRIQWRTGPGGGWEKSTGAAVVRRPLRYVALLIKIYYIIILYTITKLTILDNKTQIHNSGALIFLHSLLANQ